jgi:hypothetical protein
VPKALKRAAAAHHVELANAEGFNRQLIEALSLEEYAR